MGRMEGMACRGLIAFAIVAAMFMAKMTSSVKGIDHLFRQKPTPTDLLTAVSKFNVLEDLKKGESHDVLMALKFYLSRFGYLHLQTDINPTPQFDDALETALRLYQSSFNLSVTGRLDRPTLDTISKPRCGREDVRDGLALMLLPKPKPINRRDFLAGPEQELDVQHWNFIAGRRMWQTTRNLTYAFSRLPQTAILSPKDIRAAVSSAFESWAAVIPLNFVETDAFGEANIKIEFVAGDHGDGSPFDGRLGILSHAFAPEDGRFHLDIAEVWTVSMAVTDEFCAIDLETVALHEIGHLIGLDHSNVAGSVMFPRVETRNIRRDLTEDDVEGARALYGTRTLKHPPLHKSEFLTPDRELYHAGFGGRVQKHHGVKGCGCLDEAIGLFAVGFVLVALVYVLL